MTPLEGIRVLDFSSLLPGPLASLILGEAGAEVIKVERPGAGEDMRGYEPRIDGTGAGFALLNRGKRSIALDLRDPAAYESIRGLVASVDVLIEQFRPGVMNRLGLGYEAVSKLNPRIIYCAITGYGQSGPKALVAGHDLNYAAETGLLNMTAGVDGTPAMPPTLIADIGGGSYPAVVNILLALRRRDMTGEGCFIDVAMADNLFTFMFWGLALGHATGAWPRKGGEQLTGASPRYHIYRTADSKYLAAGPLEDKFWHLMCEVIRLPVELRDDRRDPSATTAAAAQLIAAHPADYWQERFSAVDACCTIVRTLEEAVRDIHFLARGLFDRKVSVGAHILPALPTAVVPSLRCRAELKQAPFVGQDNHAVLQPHRPAPT
jgi:crotonobetainyl-CoA:carnitine CoA-transferase CaiB-like acyl-CoA transferase